VKAIAGLTVMVIALVVATGGTAKLAVPRCARSAPAQGPSGLPAPVSLATRCAEFRLQPDGSVRSRGPGISRDLRRPAVSFGDGISWSLIGRRLTAHRGNARVWRSTGRYPRLFDVQRAVIGANAVAFLYRSRLFVAEHGGAERPVARDEWPLGWSRVDLLYTRRRADVRLRAADGALVAVAEREARAVSFDPVTRTLLTVTRDARLERLDGRTATSLVKLSDLRLPVWTWPQPLAGGLIGLTAQHRVAILRADGSLFASASFPRGRRWNAAANSGLVADPSGRAVALTLTEGDTGYASRGAEWLLLLREGDRAPRVVHREQLRFAVCERWTTLAWHRDWLLYSSTEGRTLAVDTSSGRVVDLTPLVARLPAAKPSGEHKVELEARWAL
jgi:hypothetical protein